jgi:hypothetical protein
VDLHGLANGHANDHVEGEDRCLRLPSRVRCSGAVVRGVVDLHALKEEDAPAEPIVATGVLFIAIETQT